MEQNINKLLCKEGLPNLAQKMGLKPKANGLQGKYKGYFVDITMGISTNIPKAYSAYSQRDASKIYGRQIFNPSLQVILQDEKFQFPSLAFYQEMSWWRTNQKIQDLLLEREPNLPKMDTNTQGLKKIQVYGTDEATAQKILQDARVQELLADWIYPDIRLEGNQIKLVLDNNNLLNEMGSRLQNTDYIIQATEICVAIAEAIKA